MKLRLSFFDNPQTWLFSKENHSAQKVSTFKSETLQRQLNLTQIVLQTESVAYFWSIFIYGTLYLFNIFLPCYLALYVSCNFLERMLKYVLKNFKFFFLPTKSWKEHPKKLHTYGSWEFFYFAAPTAQKNPELHFCFINYFFQSSLLRSLVQIIFTHTLTFF